MSDRKLYSLTDEHVEVLKAWAEYGLSISTDHKERGEAADASHALTPLDAEDAVERMARGLSEHWRDIHTEALLDIISKGLWAQREPEILSYWDEDPEEVRATYRREAAELMKRECMDRARAALDALLGGGQE